MTVVENAVCAGCGCVCDDIRLHTDAATVVAAQNACRRGEDWFRRGSESPAPAWIDGRPATLDDAIDLAAGCLHRADSPLLFGLGQATCEAQSQAIALAELIGGTIDSDTSRTHGPMELASQLGGKVTCTLGEVKNRADLIVYWGADPAESHPRHFERYTADARGKFRPNGRADRTVVAVDIRETATTAAADVFLRVRPGRDFEALTILRAIVQGSRFEAAKVADTGLSLEHLRDLAGRMTRARYGVVFVGSGLLQTRGGFMNCAAVTALVIELNARTRFVSMPMRAAGNVSGADAVLGYTTGYPFGVNYGRGYPRYNPGEFTAAELLGRGEADAAIIVGAESLALLPAVAREHLTRIPTVVLDSGSAVLPAKVQIVTARGCDTAGTVYRMDRVPLTLRPPFLATAPTDQDVLRRIHDAAARMQTEGR